jgi:drug/metabolite transporter (DMT)-like permease
MCLVWGIPYMFIKVAVDGGIAPVVVAWGRVTIAAFLLVPIAVRAGQIGPLLPRWRPLLAFAVIEIVVPFPLLAAGEQRIASSLAAILIATVPLLIAVGSFFFDPTERVGRGQGLGLLVGFLGVVVLLGIDVAGRPDELVGAAMTFGTAIGYATGPIVVRRYLSDLPPLGPAAAAMAVSALLLTPAALVSLPTGATPPAALAAVVVLGVVCSAVAFLLFFFMIAEVGPARASVMTYIHPVVALALGVTFQGEGVRPTTLGPLLLILAGSWLATRRRKGASEASEGLPSPAARPAASNAPGVGEGS